MLSQLADTQKAKLLILWTIVLSAAGTSIIGLDSAFGGNLVKFLNTLFKSLGAQGDIFFGLFVDNRIHSTLQYPNAMASYVMAVFFVTVGLLMAAKKIWQKAAAGGLAFILILTFMLTRSRGAQLLFPVAVIIFMLAVQRGNRVKAASQVMLLCIPAVVIFLIISPYLSADVFSFKAFMISIFGILTTALIGVIAGYIGDILQKINWKVYIGILSASVLLTAIAVVYVTNSFMPVELSRHITEENKIVTFSRDIALKPDKEYILSYEAEAGMEKEQPYAYFVRIFSKNDHNNLFGGSTQLLRENIADINTAELNAIHFTTLEDTKLINISFSVNYAGTGVTVDNAKILDAETGKTVKKIPLQYKYNLDSIISRFLNITQQGSLILRTIFYKDGLKIFGSRWLLGSGGGAWNYLYRQYQSYNYASSQAHNFPLQLGIETGIIGISVLLCLIISVTFVYIRYYKKNRVELKDSIGEEKESNILNSAIITAIAALLMHSVIDFDFSEAAMLLLFWQLIAIFNNETGKRLTFKEMLLFDFRKVTAVKKQIGNTESLERAGVAIGIVLTGIAFVLTMNFYTASLHARKAYDYIRENNIEESIGSIKKSIAADPFNELYVTGYGPVPTRPDIKTGYADLLFMKNDWLRAREQKGENITEKEKNLLQKEFSELYSLIIKNEKKAQNNINFSSNLAGYFFKTGQIDKGLEFLDNSINLFPFEPSLWHSKVDIYYQLVGKHFNNEEYGHAEKYLDMGLNVINEAVRINKRNINPFLFNNDTVELLGKMQFMKDNWGQDNLKHINDIIHYTIPNLDINTDNVPDQWGSNDFNLVNVSIINDLMNVKTADSGFIYTRDLLNIEKESKYVIEVKVDKPIHTISYQVIGIFKEAVPFIEKNNHYISEFQVESLPNEKGNQLRIFLESNCNIQNIIVRKTVDIND